jgi:hypothetical protein
VRQRTELVLCDGDDGCNNKTLLQPVVVAASDGQ